MSKLKTLKDYDLESSIPCYLSETNNIEGWNKWSYEHLALNIRLELQGIARGWIKELKKEFKKNNPESYFFISGCEDEITRWIKHFFNLEDKDE